MRIYQGQCGEVFTESTWDCDSKRIDFEDVNDELKRLELELAGAQKQSLDWISPEDEPPPGMTPVFVRIGSPYNGTIHFGVAEYIEQYTVRAVGYPGDDCTRGCIDSLGEAWMWEGWYEVRPELEDGKMLSWPIVSWAKIPEVE